jgi:hypothetical protein
VTWPAGDLTYPAGTPTTNSPRRALLSLPGYIRCLRTWSSASFINPGQPEQQTIRVLGRVVNPVGVGEQDTEPGTEFDEVMPVLARAGQSAHLQAEDQADPIEGDLGEQPLEPRPPFDRLPALAQVVVDHEDLRAVPSEGDGAIVQCVLTCGRFLVVEDLLRGRLPDVDDGSPVEVPGLELGG